MLERCPNYEICDINKKQLRGNGELYCLGSLNWEFCPEFQFLLNGNNIFYGYSRDGEIRKIGTSILKDIKAKWPNQISLSLILDQGEVLFRDRYWTETDLLLIQNITRYKIHTIGCGEAISLINGEKFLFLKIHSAVMIVCKTISKLNSLKEIMKPYLAKYQKQIEEYLIVNHQLLNIESPSQPEENLVLALFEELQNQLETINPKRIVTILNKIQERITKFFSWNHIFYEISNLIERLEDYPVRSELNQQEKEEILLKIKEWQNTFR
ncbi:MAG: hypothetical protein ACTSRS_09355 [Candidatus Helarchaeota archaeon]